MAINGQDAGEDGGKEEEDDCDYVDDAEEEEEMKAGELWRFEMQPVLCICLAERGVPRGVVTSR